MTDTATLSIQRFALSPFDRAVSDEAGVLRQLIREASEFSNSIAVGEPKRAAQEVLAAVFSAAQVDDWDLAGSRRVEPSTYEYAAQFLRLLPISISSPDVAVDNDGEILFEWDQGPRQVFSVSVGMDGTLTYAGLFGHTKSHGTEHAREALPMDISRCLERLSAPPGS